MASPPSDSLSGATNLTFVTLPLTPPGKTSHNHRCQDETEACSTAIASSPLFTFPATTSPSYPPSSLASSYPSGRANNFVYGSKPSTPNDSSSFQYVSDKQQSRILSPNPTLARKPAFLSRGPSFASRDGASQHPFSRVYSLVSDASPQAFSGGNSSKKEDSIYGKDSKDSDNADLKAEGFWRTLRRIMKPGSRPSKRLLVLIILNFAYSTIEFLIGLFTRRIGLVSDAFHLTFGCGVLTFSLFAMMWADHPPDKAYTYGYKRLEVLAAFTNALFLLFLSFSLAVESLHAFVQDESEHKHYLIVSAVANLLVNLLGVWFFRSYARVHVVYRKAQDINLHSICLHVLSDSVRSAGVILASWLLTFGVTYAETLCLGLVSVAIFLTTMPLFQASGAVLLQMAPTGTSAAALNKCLRQVRMLDDVVQCYNARFWDMVPGYIVGTLLMQVREGADEQSILKSVHSIYNDVGVKDLTVEIEVYE